MKVKVDGEDSRDSSLTFPLSWTCSSSPMTVFHPAQRSTPFPLSPGARRLPEVEATGDAW